MLYKNVLRTYMKKWMQLLAIGVIICLSALIYTAAVYSIQALEDPTYDYLKLYAQEHFSVDVTDTLTETEYRHAVSQAHMPQDLFSLSEVKSFDPSLFESIMDARKQALLADYPYALIERRQLKDFYFEHRGESHRALFIKDAKHINRSYIEKGCHPESEEEIALTAIYANKNDIHIGDTFSLFNRDFMVVGFVLFPDYTLWMQDDSFIIDNAKQTLFLSTNCVYESMPGRETVRFSGRVLSEKDKDDYVEHMSDTYFEKPSLNFVTAIVATRNQMRSGAIYDELRASKVMTLGLSLFIVIIAILIIGIILYKVFQREQNRIGLLMALGYTRHEMAWPYIIVTVVFACPMLLLGYAIGVWLANPLMQVFLEFYLLPSKPIVQQMDVFATAFFLPLFVFGLLCTWVIYRLLRKEPLSLLVPKRNEKVHKMTRKIAKILKTAKSQTKFQVLYAVQNWLKFFIFFMGIAFSTVLILLGLMMTGMVDRLTVMRYENTLWQYESYVDDPRQPPALSATEEPFLVYRDASFDQNAVTVFGMDANNRLSRLFDERGSDITYHLEEGSLITKSIAIKYELNPGDQLSVRVGPATIFTTVRAVVYDYADIIYFSRERLSLALTDGARKGLYNGVYGTEPPKDPSAYALVQEKDALMEQANHMQDFVHYMMIMILSISMLLGFAILFILTAMTVEENIYNISLLKVMGYRKKEVHRMILGSYLIYAIISYVISLPIARAGLHGLIGFFATAYDIVIPLHFDPLYVPVVLLFILIVFFLGTWSAKNKIEKTPLQETLKAYQE